MPCQKQKKSHIALGQYGCGLDKGCGKIRCHQSCRKIQQSHGNIWFLLNNPKDSKEKSGSCYYNETIYRQKYHESLFIKVCLFNAQFLIF